MLGGPVLHWELVRAGRGRLVRLLCCGYLAWLLLQFLYYTAGYAASVQGAQHGSSPGGRPDPIEALFARADFAGGYVTLVHRQQLFLIILLTPALTAGALGHEKERNTLAALFGTQLKAREIVAGKLVGRLAVLLSPLLAALPLLLFVAGQAGLDMDLLLFVLAQEVLLAFALAGASMLCSVWTRRTGDAILATYATIAVTYLATLILADIVALPDWLATLLDWLDPFWIVRNWTSSPTHRRAEVLLGLASPGLPPALPALHLAFWTFVGTVSLVLAVKRLLPASLGQWEGRPRRWRWAYRPPVGDRPVRWRERHVIGLAPFPWLRRVPGWMALLGALCFSSILAWSSLDRVVRNWLLLALHEFDLTAAGRLMKEVRSSEATGGGVLTSVNFMGFILLLLSALVVGVRCGGTIAEEKRRKTWEDLILTALPLDEILRDKRSGVIWATIPYLLVYALPMFALSSLNGMSAYQATVVWLALSGVVVVVAAYVGTSFAVGEKQIARRNPAPDRREAALAPSWLSVEAVAIAQTMQKHGVFNCMPQLADALERAGCTDSRVLEHCRQSGEHVRGSWVVDAVLAKG